MISAVLPEGSTLIGLPKTEVQSGLFIDHTNNVRMICLCEGKFVGGFRNHNFNNLGGLFSV
jgi:hypothetical protein